MAKRNMRFTTRLKELREEAGLSMLELAREIGVSDAAICKWENGLAEPKIGYIVKLAEYFDCPVDYLIGIDGVDMGCKLKVTDGSGKIISRTPNMRHPQVSLTDDEQVIISSYNKLSPKMKTLLKETLDTWVDVGEGKPKTNS